MKVRMPMLLPGEDFEAFLSETPSQVARGEMDTVLEVSAGAPTLFQPGRLDHVELVDASPAELEALEQAGFILAGMKPPTGGARTTTEPATFRPTGADSSQTEAPKKKPWWRIF
jgi:hypothetical protein